MSQPEKERKDKMISYNVEILLVKVPFVHGLCMLSSYYAFSWWFIRCSFSVMQNVSIQDNNSGLVCTSLHLRVGEIMLSIGNTSSFVVDFDGQWSCYLTHAIKINSIVLGRSSFLLIVKGMRENKSSVNYTCVFCI